jgi:hypothetical protein
VSSRRRVSPAALVLGLVGAFCGALVLSVLFAHPAGATPLPGPTAPTHAVSDVTQPVIPGLSAVADPAAAPAGANSANPVAVPAVDALQTAPQTIVRGLAAVAKPVAQRVGTSVVQVVQTITPAVVAVLDTVPVVQPVGTALAAVSLTIATFPAHPTTGPPAEPATLGSFPVSPRPFPTPVPVPPFQMLPLVTGSAPAGDSSTSSGSSAPAVAPASGLLLPDPMVSGVIPGKSGIPQLLFDLRSSPPG